MRRPFDARQVWFGRGQSEDSMLLSDWRDAPLTFGPDTSLESGWNVDRYEAILGRDLTGELFRRAAQLVLRNQFYPPEVMAAVSDFSQENRPVRAGDRIVQRIRVLQYNTRPVLEVLTMNEITAVTDEPRAAGFTYTTTQAHSEIGEWAPRVEWREDGEVALIIEVVSRSRPGTSRLGRRLTRHLQLRAHQMSIENFRALLSGRTYHPQSNAPVSMGHLAPLTVAALSALLVFFLLSRRKTWRSPGNP